MFLYLGNKISTSEVTFFFYKFLSTRDLLPGNLGTGENLVLAVGELRDLFSGNINKWNWFGSTNSSVFLMLIIMLM